MQYLLIIFLFASFFCKLIAQENTSNYAETPVSISINDYTLYGTLAIPNQKTKELKVALFIAGSGPSDRNGNNSFGVNCNAYQMFCQSLTTKGIATLRFDKLGSGESKPKNLKELVEKRDFESEVADVVAWIEFLKKDKRFSEIILMAHSQGTLVGTLAIQKTGNAISKFVSIAGVGRRGNETIKEQLSVQPKFVTDVANPILDSLSNGLRVNHVPPFLEVLFKPSIQPYLLSWFKYDPADELAKLKITSLVIQGTRDIQIKVEDAKYLVSKSKNASLLIIENMNHVLKMVESDDRNVNLATYMQPDLPISNELVEKVTEFSLKQK